AAGTPIDVSLENQSTFNLQRKTLLGTHLEYQFNKNFSVGGTIMHLSEMPLVTKTEMGSEPIANTIWGLNASYRGESQWLTNVIDKIPGINATAPSTIVFNGEFAHLIPGHRKIKHNSGYAYLDDFESTKTGIDLRYPYYWHLASTPYDPAPDALFSEAAKSNDVDYGKNRALMSWYSIDNSVFNRNNSTTPEHIRRDKDLQSNHLTREVLEQEIFPNREGIAGQSSYLSVLNLSYYPLERGPYNLDVDGMNPDGTLSNPEKRWGGMMRKIETSDFETSNIEYIEFWMMDPFVNDKDGVAKGGDLYFNLGDISEDILKDGKKFFENGMSITGDTLESERTIWGRVPRSQSMVLAFDNDAKARIYQDVGFDGLRTEEEHTFSTYQNYVEGLRGVLSPAAIAAMELDPYSPLNDPAGDNFHHYRGSDYDEKEVSILKRYKRYCGVEGNSQATGSEVYTTSSTTVPDVEDINQDNTLNEYEKYFQYKVSLRRSDLEIGKNYITDKIVANVELANGTKENVTWYQFKIPIREYTKKIGSIRDFKSIRFMRMFLHDFKEETHLRFGTLELVRGEWRTYTKDLFDIKTPPTSVGQIDVSAVNIEENINKEPVNYVLPPGVTRETDPSQPQLRQENEQSMLIKIKNLSPDDARAVYKNINYDMRQYRRIQMFTHAEKLVDDATDLKDYEMTLFLRMGSDNQSNYYEYEIPLKLTPAGHYNSNDADVVWPKENMIDFPLVILTKIKQ
ncbi:MAG TPA: cell surface protein SprA, partial [Paludibacteraceae bacterium]|nr:cell surface protein SprA [Paludibacteraceae bacterium]